MLTSIREFDGQKVMARDSVKSHGPFLCPKCHSQTVLRKGRVKVHHFAHKPPVFCQYGQGESDVHRECKQSLFNCLSQIPAIGACELEKDLGKVIPDVFFMNANTKIAIEIQISSLTMERIMERTEEYGILGIYVLWLPIMNNSLYSNAYAPRHWERWLHATYYGRVYYWIHGLTVAAIHFDDYQLWVEGSQWYTSDGEETSAGGYFKKSKRYRTPNHGPNLHLLDDFRYTYRSAWTGGNIIVPSCRILVDKHSVWWKRE